MIYGFIILPNNITSNKRIPNKMEALNTRELGKIIACEYLSFIDDMGEITVSFSSSHKLVYITMYNDYHRLSSFRPFPFIKNDKIKAYTGLKRSTVNKVIRDFKEWGVFETLAQSYIDGKRKPTQYKGVINIVKSKDYKLISPDLKDYNKDNYKKGGVILDDKSPKHWANYHKNKQLELEHGEYLPEHLSKFEKVQYGYFYNIAANKENV